MDLAGGPARAVFGVFEFDYALGELLRKGVRVDLQHQPLEVLRLLISRSGEIVTREEIRAGLWPADEYGDFDHRLNVAMTKIRAALGDSAESPRFIETIPRHGYRFIAPVHQVTRSTRRRLVVAGGVAIGALLLAGFFYSGWRAGRGQDPIPAERIMLAVLPFEDLGGPAAEDYFAAGLTEELITQLSQLNSERVGVIARTSVAPYKGTSKSIREIGLELNVDYVLEGSVRREADRVRIAVQLVRTEDQSYEWAQGYESGLIDSLAMQREIAERVASSLAVGVLRPAHAGEQGPAPLTSTAAFENYLKGRYYRDQHSVESLGKATQAFRLAILADPGYGPAYAGLASCSCLLSGHGLEIEPPTELMGTAKEMALRALAIDDTLAEAHSVLAMAHMKFDWDFGAAERQFLKAIELNRSDARGRIWYSLYLEALGRHDEAVAQAQIGRDLDPLSLEANTNLGMQLLGAGQRAEGLKQIEATVEMKPDFWGSRWALGNYYLLAGEYEEALFELERAAELSGFNTVTVSSYGYACAKAGRRPQALAALERLARMAEERYVSPAHFAVVHAGLGDRDAAFEWLERAFEQRSRYIVWIAVAPEFEDLRSDPRHRDLVARIGLPVAG